MCAGEGVNDVCILETRLVRSSSLKVTNSGLRESESTEIQYTNLHVYNYYDDDTAYFLPLANVASLEGQNTITT